MNRLFEPYVLLKYLTKFCNIQYFYIQCNNLDMKAVYVGNITRDILSKQQKIGKFGHPASILTHSLQMNQIHAAQQKIV